MEKSLQRVVIKAKTGWLDIDLKEVWQYRDLIWQFVKRDLALVYKQTILGPLWLFLNPLLSSVVFTVVFGSLVGLSSDSVPRILFYFAGTSMWWLFSKTFSVNSEVFIANKHVFSKVYFPRLAVPISQVITAVINYCVQLVLLVAFYVFYLIKGEVTISPWILLVPVLILQCALLGTGVGLVISALTTKYRDLVIATGFGLQLWMYASPVIYPLSSTALAPRINFVLRANPMTAILENFRFMLLGSGSFMRTEWIVSWVITLVALFAGVVLFSRTQRTFADTI